jgi:protein phosphatase
VTLAGAIRWFGATDVGRSRPNNEDCFHVDDGLQTAILADGMGGANCGEVGSAETVEGVLRYLRDPEDGLQPEELVKEAIRAANRRVLDAARARQECDGMGSTVVVALWRPPEILLANVGDSRAYIYRGGVLRQVSYDQNFANDLRVSLGFSEERARAIPNGNVLTMAIGAFEHVLIRTHAERLQSGDLVLLCSDGLHGPVGHDAICRILGEPTSLRERVEKLIACANQSGGPDNVTAVLLEYKEPVDG